MDNIMEYCTATTLAREYEEKRLRYYETHDEALCILMQAIVSASQSLLTLAQFEEFLKLTGPIK